MLKLSGEALASQASGNNPGTNSCFNSQILDTLAVDIAELSNEGFEICVVIGGGNIYRGALGEKLFQIERTTSDYMGMLATLINSLALQQAIECHGVPCQVMSALSISAVAETYTRRRAVQYLGRGGRVLIFSCGTGNPFFTTDTAAALRALEMNCDVVLKATNVDGIYSKDPKIYNDAEFYPKLTYDEVIHDHLKVMDETAFTMLKDHQIPLLIFSLHNEKAIKNALFHKGKFSLITN
jgi:uridylate kinase